MNDKVMLRLIALGLKLPLPPHPLGAYKAVIEAGSVLYVSMQGPVVPGHPKPVGLLGKDLTIEDGQAAARLAVLNSLAQIHQHLGGFEQVRQIIRLEGYVACVDDFIDHPAVLDGASRLLVDLFKERAGHVRSVCGVRNLPANLPVAVGLTVELESLRDS